MKNNIAVFGGTFDPPHLGHLKLAYKALDIVDKVVFVPCFDPNHKDRNDITSFDHRINMVNLMIKKEPRFSSSTVELDRGGKSYMNDTLNEFAKDKTIDSVSLLVGLDSLEHIRLWHDYKLILEHYRLLVYARHSSSFNCIDELVI